MRILFKEPAQTDMVIFAEDRDLPLDTRLTDVIRAIETVPGVISFGQNTFRADAIWGVLRYDPSVKPSEVATLFNNIREALGNVESLKGARVKSLKKTSK